MRFKPMPKYSHGVVVEPESAIKNSPVKYIRGVLSVQLKADIQLSDDVISVRDDNGRLKEWFGNYPASVVVVRPDRFVAAVATPQTLLNMCQKVRQKLFATTKQAEKQYSESAVLKQKVA